MLDVVRSTVPLEDCEAGNVLHRIPAGTEGTVVEVYGGGKAFEVDFDLRLDPANPDSFTTVTMSVGPGQCELVWKFPRNRRDQG